MTRIIRRKGIASVEIILKPLPFYTFVHEHLRLHYILIVLHLLCPSIETHVFP